MAWRRTGDKAIIYTNADPVHQCIYASLGGDEFMPLASMLCIISHLLLSSKSDCVNLTTV